MKISGSKEHNSKLSWFNPTRLLNYQKSPPLLGLKSRSYYILATEVHLDWVGIIAIYFCTTLCEVPCRTSSNKKYQLQKTVSLEWCEQQERTWAVVAYFLLWKYVPYRDCAQGRDIYWVEVGYKKSERMNSCLLDYFSF